MKNIKTIICGFVLMLSLSSAGWSQISFGAGLSLDLGDAIGIQGRALYGITDKIDLSADFNYYFKSDFTYYSLDVNGHYNLLTLGENITLAPLVGINMTSVSIEGFGDTSFNLNAGAFLKLPISGFEIYIEPKIIIADGSGFFLSTGILF